MSKMGINGGANNFSSDLAEFFNSITNIKLVEAAFNMRYYLKAMISVGQTKVKSNG